MSPWATYPQRDPPRQVRALAEQIEADGGHVLAVYQEPLGDHWQVFCLLPLDRVASTPFQRRLSPTHVKRLQEVFKKLRRFVDPIVVVSPAPGVYWTPNGNHRRAALEKLQGERVPAIAIPDPAVAYQILALNTEKAHNLKEKALEVVGMYRALAAETPRAAEDDYAFQFEAAHYVTLGLCYESDGRFAGGAFAPILRRVDRFLRLPLPAALRTREERAAQVRAADEVLNGIVARLRRRGLRHPYVKTFVLARTTPLGRARKTLPLFDTTFKRLIENLEAFDPSSVRYEDVARAALMAAPPGGA